MDLYFQTKLPPQNNKRLKSHKTMRTTLNALVICIALISLIFVFVVYVLFLITWLVVQPTTPIYSIKQGFISGYNLTNDQLNANFHFVLLANNPNRRMPLYYDRIDVTVLYDDQKLFANNVHPFYQPRINVTVLDLDLVAKDAPIDRAMARDLRTEQASGEVNLDVKIRAKIRLKVGLFKLHRTLKVLCGSFAVPFDSHKSFKRVPCDAEIDP